MSHQPRPGLSGSPVWQDTWQCTRLYTYDSWTQMCGLTVVFEGSDSLAELQRVQRLLRWRCCCLRGCRIIKSSLFNLHRPWNLNPHFPPAWGKNDRYCSCRLFHVASLLILESLRNSAFGNDRNNFASPQVWLLVFTTMLLHRYCRACFFTHLWIKKILNFSLLTNKKVKGI